MGSSSSSELMLTFETQPKTAPKTKQKLPPKINVIKQYNTLHKKAHKGELKLQHDVELDAIASMDCCK
eukprot:m.58077 g.58077  ORF g.58077 m.58077 type:complete len:68 (+) comp22492_c0_seq1:2267-2470(+)